MWSDLPIGAIAQMSHIDIFHVTSHTYRSAHLDGKTKLCSTDRQLFVHRLHQVVM